MQHTMTINSEDVQAIIHYSTVDAVFRTLDGRPVLMEFHHYLGPGFFLEDGDGGWIPEVDTPEWDNLWRQFEGWWAAKGKGIYRV